MNSYGGRIAQWVEQATYARMKAVVLSAAGPPEALCCASFPLSISPFPVSLCLSYQLKA